MTAPTPLNAADISAAPRCFGCGLSNAEGLRIEIFRDGDHVDRLVGRYRPRPTAGGFPEIVHGGALFTALDCMAGWVPWIFRSAGATVWLTKTSTMRYHRPARLASELALAARVLDEPASPREPLPIRAEIHDQAGELLCDADFYYSPVSGDRLLRIVGLESFPDSYRRHFAER